MDIHTMTDSEHRAAAKAFITTWAGRGDEKQDAQNYWRELLSKVYGLTSPESEVLFEHRVKNDQTGTTIFIDAYIKATSVLIEQKGKDVDLRKGYRQSDGSMLTPYQQARRYAGLLPHNMNPRWIVVCNFQEFHIHDMNNPNAEPYVVKLADLKKEYNRLNFLIDTGNENLKREMEISIKAGDLVGKLYDAFLKQYKDPTNEASLHSLNALCVRLVFCLYAEDSGLFEHLAFHDYLQHAGLSHSRQALIDLFHVLDQDIDQRDPYLSDELSAFPYVNGGLFSDENIEIPRLTEEIYNLLLRNASEDFDWSEISPTIFGAVFESTLNPETRRKGGMHYTSIENIHKVIDPLFLDDLKAEFTAIKAEPVPRTRKAKLQRFQDKLASLSWLDPAAGSGNFLTETFLSVRRLENEVILELTGGQVSWGEIYNPIKVSIDQFYGIEINDFAVTVAKTALWIAESQMMKATEDIIRMDLNFLPLKTNAHIVQGNALRLDWNSVVPKERLSYIMGNPPFVGKKEQSPIQKKELVNVFGGCVKGTGNLDYVAAWYCKAVNLMEGTAIKAAFVSTNSITQGEQVPVLWKYLLSKNINVIFAHKTFVWDSEASLKAHVHCVIIGFAIGERKKEKRLYVNGTEIKSERINPYLLDAPEIIVESRSKPICDVLPIMYGSMPIDNGHLTLSEEDVTKIVAENPVCKDYIRDYIGGNELINGKWKKCLWLKGAKPTEIRKSKLICERIQLTELFRKSSNRPQTLELANTPYLFGEIRQPDTTMIVIPKVSSERRKYIPIDFISPDVIVSGSALIIPDADLFYFGILSSNIHNAWMRTVAGRLEMRYQYSNSIVYNNFPWPTPTETQKERIKHTAQAILDARALYPDSSLADLYDERTMPSELRTAHQQNDKAVWEAYGKAWDIKSESECVAYLMRLYQEKTAK